MVEQGRKSNALFILLNGRARVLTADTRGREVILAVLESGDYVGEMSLIDNEPHSATVRAEVQTDMLILGRVGVGKRTLVENALRTLRTAEQAAAIEKRLAETGGDLNKFLAVGKLERLSDMLATQYQSAMRMIDVAAKKRAEK